MNMMMKLKAIGLALALAVAPLAVSAAAIQLTSEGIIPGSNVNDITIDVSIFYAENGIQVAGTRVFNLLSNPMVESKLRSAVNTLEFTGAFQGLSVTLTDLMGTANAVLVSSTDIASSYRLDALFTAVNGFAKVLTVSWTGVGVGEAGGTRVAGFQIQGTPTPIPVPAAGFLLVGALGGLAALRRRRKAAAPSALAAA
jgi:hypothetical protein